MTLMLQEEGATQSFNVVLWSFSLQRQKVHQALQLLQVLHLPRSAALVSSSRMLQTNLSQFYHRSSRWKQNHMHTKPYQSWTLRRIHYIGGKCEVPGFRACPNLQSYLSVCATSSPSECLFSTSGNIVTMQRVSLKPDKVDMLVFLTKTCKLYTVYALHMYFYADTVNNYVTPFTDYYLSFLLSYKCSFDNHY